MTAERGQPELYRHIAVLGAGAWGTALALVAARAGRQVSLWGRDSRLMGTIQATRRNAKYLPDAELPSNICAADSLPAAGEADAILVAVPAQQVRGALSELAPYLTAGAPVAICAKGIEHGTGKLMNEMAAEYLDASRIGMLSGPSFARDVAADLPTAVTVAAPGATANRLQASLGSAAFRPYATDDVAGVALGGAAKNVYAIACGIVKGMRLGESARAALLARSFAELRRLGDAIGARGETLMGLSGLGDLVLTASSFASRNFSFGVAVGKGAPVAALKAEGHPLAEGVATAPALVARAHRQGIELPVAETAAAILDGAMNLETAVPLLMNRPLKPE